MEKDIIDYAEHGMKRCMDCGQILSIDFFYGNKRAKDRHLPFCKECAKKRQKENYYKRKQKEKEKEKEPKIENLIVGEKHDVSRKKSLKNAQPKDLMLELASRGYYGVLYYNIEKEEVIEHEGKNGIFKHTEKMCCDIQKLYKEK